MGVRIEALGDARRAVYRLRAFQSEFGIGAHRRKGFGSGFDGYLIPLHCLVTCFLLRIRWMEEILAPVSIPQITVTANVGAILGDARFPQPHLHAKHRAGFQPPSFQGRNQPDHWVEAILVLNPDPDNLKAPCP